MDDDLKRKTSGRTLEILTEHVENGVRKRRKEITR